MRPPGSQSTFDVDPPTPFVNWRKLASGHLPQMVWVTIMASGQSRWVLLSLILIYFDSLGPITFLRCSAAELSPLARELDKRPTEAGRSTATVLTVRVCGLFKVWAGSGFTSGHPLQISTF